MRTDDLITLLAQAPLPTQDARGAARQFRRSLLLGALVPLAVVLLLAAMQRQRFVSHDVVIWVKLAFAGVSAAAAGAVLWTVGHPGLRAGRAWRRLAWTWGALWLLTSAVVLRAAPGQRRDMLLPAFDATAWHCALAVALLALPALGFALRALRGLAPTQPVVAGAAAGVFAGSVGALAFALICTEWRLPVIALWYPAGILLAAIVGATAGPRVLRW